MDLQLKEKIAVITAASGGIGRETARTLAAEGVQTILVARRVPLLEELADEIEQAGHPRPMVIGENAASDGAADRVREKVLGKFGRVDIVVNNLGQARVFKLKENDEAWEEAFRLNFHSARKMTEAFIEGMIERNFGRIINLTSTLEPFGMSGSHTSKAALLVWAKGLSRQVAKHDVTVNCLSPGLILTDQIRNDFIPRFVPTEEKKKEFFEKEIPAGHFGDPADAANLITFLCSPKAGYITGQRICVDGGWYRHV